LYKTQRFITVLTTAPYLSPFYTRSTTSMSSHPFTLR
jgi:hypothetical protein